MVVDINHDLFYKLRSGKYVSEVSMKKAYEIITGKECVDTWSLDPDTLEEINHLDQEYSKWLYSLLGKTVLGVSREEDIPVEGLVRSNSILLATKVYRNQHNCSLKEAHEAVSNMRREYEENNR